MTLEKSLVFVKPGNSDRVLEIFDFLDNRLENFSRTSMVRVYPVPEGLIREQYENIKGKSFYEATIQSYLQGEIYLSVYKGERIIWQVRLIIGDTDPVKAGKDTIRGFFGKDSLGLAFRERRYLNNVIHASANKKEAERELHIWRAYLS